jgi:arginyl-tRNA synthetase
MAMKIETTIQKGFSAGMLNIYGHQVPQGQISVQPTRPDFEGDFTIVVFPFLRFSKKSPEETAKEMGQYLEAYIPEVESFNVIKGFLNISLSPGYWLNFFSEKSGDDDYGFVPHRDEAPVVIEYSSPNTNKPLHLGHIRNNLLGFSISEILKANGYRVERVNLVNDRGIHICKTMLEWQRQQPGTTPGEANMKGDKFVGNLYVQFENDHRKQVEELISQGMDKDEAIKSTPLIKEANDLLRRWEAGDKEVRSTWETMNKWVYEGFDETYRRMGIEFDRVYYESETYLLGKELVEEGLERGIFYRKDDGSVWIDLSAEGLDSKLLLRSDGTSVYMTQDLGTAQVRYDDFKPSRLLYVVGNEQNYHFDVLKLIMQKLKRPWADGIHHVSYGMVELPQGKMKSREGTVVDADELMEEMHRTAKRTTEELGKVEGRSPEEAEELYELIGMGALKYFILKVDPKKNMLFNPEDSIDFNGNTGPFIQYTHARIKSLLRKGEERGFEPAINVDASAGMLEKERYILRIISRFPDVVMEAGEQLSPALVANFSYELAKEYNQYYQEVPVLREADKSIVEFRLALGRWTALVLNRSMSLLGIKMPERM